MRVNISLPSALIDEVKLADSENNLSGLIQELLRIWLDVGSPRDLRKILTFYQVYTQLSAEGASYKDRCIYAEIASDKV